MMTLKPVLLLLAITSAAFSIDQFRNQKEIVACIDTCETPISACLKEVDSACAKAYIQCHTHKNFLTCIQSANGIIMQEISKCMREKCQPIQEEQTETPQVTNEMEPEFKRFKHIKSEDVFKEVNEDIEGEPAAKEPAVVVPGDSSNKDGNRR